MSHKLKVGEVVTINVPFSYTIGDEGMYSGKILETIEDCKDEVRAEIEDGALAEADEIIMTVEGENI